MEEIILPDTLAYIGGMAFYQCSSLKHIVIPKKAKRIGTAAFCDCPKLEIESHSSRFIVHVGFLIDTLYQKLLLYFGKEKAVTLPEGIVWFDWPAFSDSDIEEVTVPDTVKILGFRAFNSCHSLRKVTLPSSHARRSWIQLQKSHKASFLPFFGELLSASRYLLWLVLVRFRN